MTCNYLYIYFIVVYFEVKVLFGGPVMNDLLFLKYKMYFLV